MHQLSSQEDTVQAQAPADDRMEDHSLVGCSDSELGVWGGCCHENWCPSLSDRVRRWHNTSWNRQADGGRLSEFEDEALSDIRRDMSARVCNN